MKDERIVTLVVGGRKEEYGKIVEKYEEKLARYISYLINQRGEEVEDLVQETLIKAYENLAGFEEEKKFSSWLFRIAHNCVVDYFKKKRVKIERMGEEEWMEVADGLDIEKEALKEDEKKELLRLLKRLKIEEREILVLYYFEEKSYEEIGEILRLNKSNVGVRMMRAKEKLRVLVDNRL